MSMSSEAVKRTARTALKDNYIKSMICCTVFVFAFLLSIYANSLFDFVMGKVAYYIAFTLVGIFVLLPLFLGLLRFFCVLFLERMIKSPLCFTIFLPLNYIKKPWASSFFLY